MYSTIVLLLRIFVEVVCIDLCRDNSQSSENKTLKSLCASSVREIYLSEVKNGKMFGERARFLGVLMTSSIGQWRF